jgi:hypothetical protein
MINDNKKALSSHEPFDDTAKAFYRDLFKKRWGLVVETEKEVFARGRKIDLVVKCTDSDLVRLQNTIFSHFRELNALELKGINDPLTLADYNRIMMRAWGLGGMEKKKKKNQSRTKTEDNNGFLIDESNRFPDERTVTIVCVTRPDNILDQFKKRLKFFEKESGIYYCEGNIPRWIIHPTELALVEKNYPLLPLARGKKLEQFISLCVRENLVEYLQLILDIGLATDPDVIWRKIFEVKNMRPVIREDTWPYIDQFFRETPDAIGKIPTFQDALAESRRSGQQIGEQRTLIRQLRRKFARVPDKVVQKIEATNDLELLDNWLDQIITADSLAKMERVITGKTDKK